MEALQLLEIWERAFSEPPVQRALTLLSAAHPDRAREELARWSVGKRDAELLKLREEIFGGRLPVFAQCAQCGERLEFTLEADELQHTLSGPGREPDTEAELKSGSFAVRFRFPDSVDLQAAANTHNFDDARRTLIQRCVLEVRKDARPIEATDLPEAALAELAAAIAERDPGSEVGLNVNCPSCRQIMAMEFDIGSFLWDEISLLARRLLREVSTLAANFGWDEASILAMSPVRRRLYLELTY